MCWLNSAPMWNSKDILLSLCLISKLWIFFSWQSSQECVRRTPYLFKNKGTWIVATCWEIMFRVKMRGQKFICIRYEFLFIPKRKGKWNNKEGSGDNMSHGENMRSNTTWGRIRRNQSSWHKQKELYKQKYLRFGVICTVQWMI